jgi:hypothetical protein
MAKIAQLMPSILEQMYIAVDDAAKYQAVLEADRRMRDLVGALPSVVLRAQDPDVESKTPWIPTARRTLAISAADKVCLTAHSYHLINIADDFLTDHHDPQTLPLEELPNTFVPLHTENLCLRRNDYTAGARARGSRRSVLAALGTFCFRSYCCSCVVLEHDICRRRCCAKQL